MPIENNMKLLKLEAKLALEEENKERLAENFRNASQTYRN